MEIVARQPISVYRRRDRRVDRGRLHAAVSAAGGDLSAAGRAADGDRAVLQGSVPVRQRDSLSLCSSEADLGDAIHRNRCGASRLAVSAGSAWRVESGHEFAVGGAGCGEVFLAFVELLSKVSVVLLELADRTTTSSRSSAQRTVNQISAPAPAATQ